MKLNPDDFEKLTPPKRETGLSSGEESVWAWILLIFVLILFFPILAFIALPALGAFIALIVIIVICAAWCKPKQ